MRRRILWACALALVVLGAIAFAGMRAAQPQSQPAKVRYRTAVAVIERLDRVVVANGTVRPVATVVVGAQVSGTVVAVGADFNDRVRKGDVLVRLDPLAFEARERQALAQVEAAHAALVSAEDAFVRGSRLAEQGFYSESAVHQARDAVDVARAGLASAQALHAAAAIDLKNSVILSPVDGVVISRNVEVGQTIASSFQTPDLFMIARSLSEMKIIASIDEVDVPVLPTSGQVEFRLDAFPDRVFHGTISKLRLAESVQQGRVTYPLVVAAPNSDGAMRPGMTAELRISATHPGDGRVVVPTTALRFRPGAESGREDDGGDKRPFHGSVAPYRVFVLKGDGTLALREVSVGVSVDGRTEILQGKLSAGERVVTGEEVGHGDG